MASLPGQRPRLAPARETLEIGVGPSFSHHSEVAKRVGEPTHGNDLERPQTQPAPAAKFSLGGARGDDQPGVGVLVVLDGFEIGAARLDGAAIGGESAAEISRDDRGP